jgi:hypothetical protein
MANKIQILDKIQRNCEQRAIAVSRTDAETLVAGGLTITYLDADIQSPMGGIDDSINPYLGIGIANPGKIQIDGALDSLVKLRVVRIASGHANDIEIVNSGIEDGTLEGHTDLLGMGQ